MTDDDPAIRRYLARDLPSLGFIILDIDPDELAVERLLQLRPDAIVVGTNALTEDDTRLLRMVRGASRAPALVLLGNESPKLIIEALDLGASDCLSKPFSLGELAARVRKTLRWALTDQMPWHILRAGDLELDFVRGIARLRGEDVALTSLEYWVLRQLAEEAGNVVSARRLLADGWATNDPGRAPRLRRIVQALRAKLRLGQSGAADIASEPRLGYRLRLPGTRSVPRSGAVGR